MSIDPIIAVGGENLIDRVQTGGTLADPVFVDKLGGSPFNVAVGVARQGVATRYLSPISTDAHGDRLAALLNGEGVALTGPRLDAPTTMAIVTLKDGTPSYRFQRDGTAERCVSVAALEASMPQDTAILHVGSLAFAGGPDAQVWEDVVHRAKARGIFVSIDPNVRASLIDDPDSYRARMDRLCRAADLIKLSDEDLEWLYPDLSEASARDRLRADSSAGLIVLTQGPRGAWGATPAVQAEIQAAPVAPLVDTIGAGDTFMATLIAAVARHGWTAQGALAAIDHATLTTLLERASQAAALNCQQEGCNPPDTRALDRALDGTKK